MTDLNVELFAGPGGMSEALRLHGLTADVAIELDPVACATARAAGHPRIRGDVYGHNPARAVSGSRVTGLLAAPPCGGFSTGGLKTGRTDLPAILDLALRIADGGDHRADYLTTMRDHRSLLVVEPLRWAVALDPDWVVLEQVPSVLPIWEAAAKVLETRGYSTDTGIVNAADHGAPQDRPRAILLASRAHPVHLPPPSTGRGAASAVLGPGAVGFPRRADRGAAVELNGISYRARDIRRTEHPAFTVTEKARSWTLWPDGGAPRPLTVSEAGRHQTFPVGYPWQGVRSRAFHQAADAHPPLLGAALLGAVR